jgi:thiamine-phosphate pyrophosphorylase
MRHRQTVPIQWLIAASESGELIRSVRRLPRGSGVLLLFAPRASVERQLRYLGKQRALTILREGSRTAARVHDLGELRHALLASTPLILLSPLHETRSHPDWKPIPRMRAAALARLARRKLIALGGMDGRKFARLKALGFQAWAGISAFRT